MSFPRRHLYLSISHTSRRKKMASFSHMGGRWNEANFIKNIVGDVWSFLSTKLPSLVDNLVGIDSKVVDLIPFLEIGLDDKRLVGIWGMGGVGKTTLARVVSEKLSDKFEICCFLEKVKDALSLPNGLVSLQKSLLSRLRIKDLEIFDSYEGMRVIRKLLCNKKVLLILDDIDDMSQLKDLAESPDWFGTGSRIIITTRDSHLLTSFGVERIYEMKTMNDDESLQIFSKKAFNKNHPEEKYLEYSKSVVKCVGGLPLALQALGSYLCGRRGEAVWRDALDKLKQINPYKNIRQVLKVSYDGLDEKEQTIFLDIVCFFKHWEKKEVTQILKVCDLNPILGIKVLIEKTLLVETKGGILDMHELYEDLGWDIIQQKSPNSRLWKFGKIKEVLENNKLEYHLPRDFFAIMSSGGRKIPSWFDPNIKYYDEGRYECEIEVDVPPNFCASKWSGIVVCLHMEGYMGKINWSSKAPEDDKYNTWEEQSHGIWSIYGHVGLGVLVLEFNQETCWQHLRGDNNSLHILLSQLSSDFAGRIIDILGCGWRVICKEEIQNWCHSNHFNQFTQSQHAPPSELELPM
ncbi:hypothetical protein K1719_002453 [Acacia pycnantha]|nr:hypothetical protein K1719_002453 [Acacia pycnantha]